MDDDYKLAPLHIMLLKTCAYVESYDGEIRRIYFFFEDDHLLQKFDIWNKVSSSMEKNDSKPIYTENTLKTKI